MKIGTLVKLNKRYRDYKKSLYLIVDSHFNVSILYPLNSTNIFHLKRNPPLRIPIFTEDLEEI